MSMNNPGRHRVARRLTAARVTRGSAVLIATGGLIASVSAGAQAAPAQPVTQPVSLPAAPATLPAAPVMLPAHPNTSGSWETLLWGASGEQVKVVQRIVGTDDDGLFGPLTHAAVQRYQSDNGLVPDGVVGPLTSGKMGLGSGGSASSAASLEIHNTRESSASSRSSGRSAPSAPSTSDSSVSGVLGVADQYTGIMYSWGGTSPSTGFDCSGYTQYVFNKVGISLPRTAEAQRQAATPVSDPRPGDLVFYGAPAYHMGIYAGDGMMYDSGRPGLPTQKRQVFAGVTSYGRVG